MIGIYKIQNKITGQTYVGQSVDIERRWKQHKSLSTYKDAPLYEDVRKLGWDKFSFGILEVCEEHELNAKEKYWIDLYNSFDDGYNQTRGGARGSEAAADISANVSISWDEYIEKSKNLTPSALKYWTYLEYCRQRNSQPIMKEFCEMFGLSSSTYRKAKIEYEGG